MCTSEQYERTDLQYILHVVKLKKICRSHARRSTPRPVAPKASPLIVLRCASMCLNNTLNTFNTRTLNPNAHFPPPCYPPLSPLHEAQVSSRVARLQGPERAFRFGLVVCLRATAGLTAGPRVPSPYFPERRRVLVALLLLSCPICSLPFYASTMNPKATRADPSISMARRCTQQWTRPSCCPCRQYCPRRR